MAMVLPHPLGFWCIPATPHPTSFSSICPGVSAHFNSCSMTAGDAATFNPLLVPHLITTPVVFVRGTYFLLLSTTTFCFHVLVT